MSTDGHATGGHLTVGDLLIMEYDSVKQEQRARIGFRDNLLYATLGSMAAVIAVAVQGGHGLQLLLLLPPVSVLLGWTYLVNDEKISAIGRYIRRELAPQLAALTTTREPPRVLGWETAHRGDPRRRSRKWLQLAVDLMTFCGAPLAAVVVFWAAGSVSAPLVAVSSVEAFAVVGLAVQIVLYADLKGS